MAAVFPQIETWTTQGGDLVLLGSKEPLVYNLPVLRQRIQSEPYRSAMAVAWRVADLEGLFVRHLANAGMAEAVRARNTAVNTDNRNHLEFAFASTVGLDTGSVPKVEGRADIPAT